MLEFLAGSFGYENTGWKVPHAERGTWPLTVGKCWPRVLGPLAEEALRDYLMASLK